MGSDMREIFVEHLGVHKRKKSALQLCLFAMVSFGRK
jgi:hypothetical protein